MIAIRHIMDSAHRNTYDEQLEQERQAQRVLFDHPDNPANQGDAYTRSSEDNIVLGVGRLGMAVGGTAMPRYLR